MIYEASPLAVAIFFAFVGLTLGISFYMGRSAKSSAGYFAAHGQIPWFVNGIAFAGDYLSAASFLGICGMIAFYGYDGFLYSIGYLAGWIVALFVIAEPMKKLGKFTFADALNSRFQSKGIQLAAGVSTLIVSLFYLIPQMVGAGALIQPLLGFPQWFGVILVGSVVMLIVVTAGMVSTTWVQFIKGALLVLFSLFLTILILQRGLTQNDGGTDSHHFLELKLPSSKDIDAEALKLPELAGYEIIPTTGEWAKIPYISCRKPGSNEILLLHIEKHEDDSVTLFESQMKTVTKAGEILINGLPLGKNEGQRVLHTVGYIHRLPGEIKETGPLNPLSFIETIQGSEITLWREQKIKDADDSAITLYYPKITPGSKVLRPGENKTFAGIHSDKLFDKLNFLSLMLALFGGTASLPHILIRYYTVKDESSARKSTIVGIATIGLFYILTLYLGLGAMTSGALDVTDSNMSAPLLAKSMNEVLFAMISAIAFTTVLGTVSGLILAAAGAVTYDIIATLGNVKLTDNQAVRIAKFSSIVIGIIAIILGILFKSLNVTYLVGWAFSIAASANLPALIMLLFWKGVTKQGITAAILVGMLSSLGWVLLSVEAFTQVYGLPAERAMVPFSQPGIVTIPLGFLTLYVVSLLTKKKPVVL